MECSPCTSRVLRLNIFFIQEHQPMEREMLYPSLTLGHGHCLSRLVIHRVSSPSTQLLCFHAVSVAGELVLSCASCTHMMAHSLPFLLPPFCLCGSQVVSSEDRQMGKSTTQVCTPTAYYQESLLVAYMRFAYVLIKQCNIFHLATIQHSL